jgi:hypothetical protein
MLWTKNSAKPKENSTPISEMIPSAYMTANVERLRLCQLNLNPLE